MKILAEALGWALIVWVFWLSFHTLAEAQEEEPQYATATATWDAPTTRENGDELPIEELLWYEVRVHEAGNFGQDGPLYAVYETEPTVRVAKIQLLANECYHITAYAAATGSPACKPEQQYLLSRPSETVVHCTGSGMVGVPPKPPREFN